MMDFLTVFMKDSHYKTRREINRGERELGEHRQPQSQWNYVIKQNKIFLNVKK